MDLPDLPHPPHDHENVNLLSGAGESSSSLLLLRHGTGLASDGGSGSFDPATGGLLNPTMAGMPNVDLGSVSVMMPGLGLSAGEPPSSSCPFALIQAALEKPDTLPSPKTNLLDAKREERKKIQAEVKAFQKHDLMENDIPEGISMNSKKLREGLEERQLSVPQIMLSARPASQQLMCPVSGELTNFGANSGVTEPAAPDALLRVANAAALLGGGASFDVDGAIAARPEGDSRGGGSRAGGSHGGGSRASHSKKGSKTSSKMKGSSKGGSRGGKSQVRRRVKKSIKFSEWEADTYIPQIKASWQIAMTVISWDKVGLKFFDAFASKNPDLAHMFTSPREIIAIKFSEMLASIVSSVDSPTALHEKLKGLAPMHLKKGVKKEYLPRFGEVLIGMMQDLLQDSFSKDFRAAWEWLWSWLSQSMEQSLEEASNETTILNQSWDMAMDNCPGTEFGELLFDVLFEIAPNMKTIFAKPKQILSVKFMEMISTLVSFNSDTQRMAEQSVWLGLRHVRYGARPQHTQVLGQVVISTLERAVGEEWTAEMDKAWSDLWKQACKLMLDVTEEAHEHGECVRQLWDDAKQRTTCLKFGSSLRKMLLSGTEWVQGLSNGNKDDHKIDANGDGKDANGNKLSKKERRASAASMTSDNQEEETRGGALLGKPDDATATFNDKSSDADAIGTQFWDMLTALLDLLWEPEQMNEKLIVTTHHFFELGIRTAHLDTIGKAIHTTLERVMAQSWKKAHSEAWIWFWAMTAKSMAQALDVMESGDVEVIRNSWEEAKASKPAEELGEIFFKELARIAPHVTHLFKRPKRIQALQFTNVIEMLVSFNEEPEKFFQDLKPLTIRHIKYGVKADYARAFGMTILNGIGITLGDRFDDRTKKAWQVLWTRVSSCVTRSLNVGSNLVIVSLVQENLEQLIEAMDCVPRGERDEVLTRIDVNGEIISPLNWAVQGGQLAMAQFVMSDLLAIRADRYRYYYGRETLFKTHPDLVAQISKSMHALLDNLFDGLMWHAQMVQEGRVRVNYYIREMYGIPEELSDVWTSPLGVLVLAGRPEVFNHPVIEKLLEVKWERFGLKIYLAIQLWYTIMLVLFTIGFGRYGQSCEQSYVVVRLFVGAMASLTLLLQTLVLIYQLRSGQVNKAPLAYGFEISVPRFLMNPWNSARYVSTAMLIAGSFQEACMFSAAALALAPGETLVKTEFVPEDNVLIAITAIIVWLQVIQVLILSTKMAAFTYTVGRMVREIAMNFLVIFVMMIAFATALTILGTPGGYGDGIEHSLLNILKIAIGLNDFATVDLEGWSMCGIIIVVILINVCFINILVAQLVLAYNNLSGNQEGCAKMNRAYICVEMESFLFHRYRCKLFSELAFDEPLEFDSSDEGPCGGIQSLCPSSIRSHPKYIPDRVKRFTGEASTMDPWPSERIVEDGGAEDYDDGPAVE